MVVQVATRFRLLDVVAAVGLEIHSDAMHVDGKVHSHGNSKKTKTVKKMCANVLSLLKITPSEPNLREPGVREQLDKIIDDNGLSSTLEVIKTEDEPLVFGIFATKAYIVTPDSEDGAASLDLFIEKTENLHIVESIEVETQTLTG